MSYTLTVDSVFNGVCESRNRLENSCFGIIKFALTLCCCTNEKYYKQLELYL